MGTPSMNEPTKLAAYSVFEILDSKEAELANQLVDDNLLAVYVADELSLGERRAVEKACEQNECLREVIAALIAESTQQSDLADEDDTYSLREAARMKALSITVVMSAIASGQLASSKAGGEWRIRKSVLMEWKPSAPKAPKTQHEETGMLAAASKQTTGWTTFRSTDGTTFLVGSATLIDVQAAGHRFPVPGTHSKQAEVLFCNSEVALAKIVE